MKGYFRIKLVSVLLAALFTAGAFASCGMADKPAQHGIKEESAQPSEQTEAGTTADQALAQNRKERLRGVLDQYMKKQNFSGTVLVGVDNVIVYTASVGYSDRELKIHNRMDTVYEIGSLTKQFTAAAVMMFVEKGELSVEDTLEKFFPDYPYAKKVTVEQLLNMTSGIPDYLNDQLYLCETGQADPKSKFTIDDVLSIINGRELEFEPGTQFSYSNSNYYLLGNIVEQLSDMKYEDFIKLKIFKPLSMGSTSLELSKATAKGYLKDGQEGLRVDSSYFGPAGEIVSCAEDIFKWQCAFISGRVVSTAMVEKMLSNKGAGYGYGWFLRDDYCFHTGNTEAFYAIDLIGQTEDIKVVALSNVDDNATSEIGQEIYKMTRAALFG